MLSHASMIPRLAKIDTTTCANMRGDERHRAHHTMPVVPPGVPPCRGASPARRTMPRNVPSRIPYHAA